MVRRETRHRSVVRRQPFKNDRNSLSVAGFALMRIVEVYKEIQEQEMNIVSNSVSLYRAKLIAFFSENGCNFHWNREYSKNVEFLISYRRSNAKVIFVLYVSLSNLRRLKARYNNAINYSRQRAQSAGSVINLRPCKECFHTPVHIYPDKLHTVSRATV